MEIISRVLDGVLSVLFLVVGYMLGAYKYKETPKAKEPTFTALPVVPVEYKEKKEKKEEQEELNTFFN